MKVTLTRPSTTVMAAVPPTGAVMVTEPGLIGTSVKVSLARTSMTTGVAFRVEAASGTATGAVLAVPPAVKTLPLTMKRSVWMKSIPGPPRLEPGGPSTRKKLVPLGLPRTLCSGLRHR